MDKQKIKSFASNITDSVRRFPLTAVFAALLTATSIILGHADYDSVGKNGQFFMYWYPATALLLSLGMSLWYEQHRGSRTHLAASALIQLLWVGCMALLSRHGAQIMYAPYVYVLVALVMLETLGILCLPFTKSKTHAEFWNFCIRMLFALAIAAVVAGILCGGLCLLLLSIEKLFGLENTGPYYADIAFLCMFLVMTLLFLGGIPKTDTMHDTDKVAVPVILSKSVKILFIPLAVAYLLTLYVYAIKILGRWELPQGWVSWPVSISMLAVTLLYMVKYPDIQKNRAESCDTFETSLVAKWLPMLMLPLLVLMSTGIARRVSDYGFSVLRLYLIAFNLWCYTVLLCILIGKQKRIMWIPVSLVLIFAVLSIFPFNVSTSVRNRMERQVNETLAMTGWNGQQMSNDEYASWIESLDSETAALVDSHIAYLKKQFSYNQVERIVARNANIGAFARQADKTAATSGADGSISLRCYNNLLEGRTFETPAGTSRFSSFSTYIALTDSNFTVDSVAFEFISQSSDNTTPDSSTRHQYVIPLSDLRYNSEESGKLESDLHPLVYREQNGPATIVLQNFDLSFIDGKGTLHLSGLEFTE